MGFNTLPFIFIFLPVFLAVYYLMPERLRNGVLTLTCYRPDRKR